MPVPVKTFFASTTEQSRFCCILVTNIFLHVVQLPFKEGKSNIYKKNKAWREMKFSVHGWENATPYCQGICSGCIGWSLLQIRCCWHYPSCPCCLRSFPHKITRHIFGRSWCRALFSWSAHSPLGKSHHGLIQAAQQQKTFPPGENKTFSNLPFHNSITRQRLYKNADETYKLYPWRCNTHCQMSSRRQSDLVLFFPARLCGGVHTQNRHPVIKTFICLTPELLRTCKQKCFLLLLCDPCLLSPVTFAVVDPKSKLQLKHRHTQEHIPKS